MLDAAGTTRYEQAEHYAHRFYDPDTYYVLRARLEQNESPGRKGTGNPEYLLRLRLTCAHCGHTMNGRRVPRRNCRVYRCSTDGGVAHPECARNAQRAELVEALVVDELRRLAKSPGVTEHVEARVHEQLAEEEKRLREEINSLESRGKRLWDGYRFWSGEYQEGRADQKEYDFHLAEFRESRAKVEQELAAAREALGQREVRAAVLKRAQEIVTDFDKSWEALSMEQRREALGAVLEGNATMGRLPDGRTELTFQFRGWDPVTRYIQPLAGADRSGTCAGMLTPAMQRYLYWWGQGLDRQAIADKYGVSRGVVHCLLWQARKRLGADTLEEAWDTAKSEIEENLAWLLQLTRKRKHQAKPTKEGSLTKTQIALLTHMAAGDAVTDAAEQLGMSPNTAYVHLKNARDRLGAPSNQGLLQKAVDLGYIS